jgi:hypothetical protein
MKEIFTSGSVRGLIVTLGLLPQQKVSYELYSTCARIDAVADQDLKKYIFLLVCNVRHGRRNNNYERKRTIVMPAESGKV